MTLVSIAAPMPPRTARSGGWSLPKVAALAIATGPLLWLGWLTVTAAPPSLNWLIHFTGSWALRLTLLALAVTPARRLFNAPRLIAMRRTLGVAAFGYALLHVALYVGNEQLDLWKVASEIVLRRFLTFGFVAFVGLLVLATTSTDAAVRRLGAARWNALHRLVYGVATLAVAHFAVRTKVAVAESVMMAGCLAWLLGYRLLHRWRREVMPGQLVALAFAAGLVTVGIEMAAWWLRTGAGIGRLLAHAVAFRFGMPPAAKVLMAGLAIAAAAVVVRMLVPRVQRSMSASRAPARFSSSPAIGSASHIANT